MPVKHTYYYQQPNGNTYKKIIANGFEEPLEITKYSYNANNMLTKAVVEDKQNGKTTEVLYYYDALNRRNAKTSKELVNGAEISSKTTEYFWYGDKIWYEKVTDADGSEKLANLWGSRGLAARNDMTYSQDGHGSVDAEYRGTELSNEYRYDAYGNEIDESTSGNPYRYCSEYYDEETGLYYLRNRYYDPALGRFITEDPAQDGLNWYVYAGNNPVMMIDPWGLENVHVEYFSLATLTNVEDKKTGVYASLRSISDVAGATLTWTPYGNAGYATFVLDNHTIEIYFDNMREGEYASKIKVYATYGNVIDVTGWGKKDYVDNALSTQEAFFYLKKDENGNGNLVVQAKVSTMFGCAGKWNVGENFVAAWTIAKKLYYKYGEAENRSLQDYLNDPELYVLMNIDSDAVLDYYENIMRDRGEYYFD